MNSFHHNSGGTAKTRAVTNAAPVQFVPGDFTVQCPYVRVQVQLNDVYATYDGTTPAAGTGEILSAKDRGYFMLKDLYKMKFLAVSLDAKIFAQPCNLLPFYNPTVT